MTRISKAVFAVALACSACASEGPAVEDGRDDSFTTEGKLDTGVAISAAEAAAILQVVNTMSLAKLKSDVDLTANAATNIVAVRNGDDDAAGTADDDTFATIAELDAVPFIGPIAFQKLLDYVTAADLVGDVPVDGWQSQTIEHGDQADFAVGPDGKPVVLFHPAGSAGYKVRLGTGTVVAAPADAGVQWNTTPQLAVDSTGLVHLFYSYTYQYSSTSTPEVRHHHAVYRNGAWDQLAYLDVDTVVVDQGPEGQLFVVGSEQSASLADSDSLFRLYTQRADGVLTNEPMWDAEMNKNVGVNVGLDGFPAVAFWRTDRVRHARPGQSNWDYSTVKLGSSYALGTTGGQDATAFVDEGGYLRAYRQAGGYFNFLEAFPTSAISSMDVTYDRSRIAHACFVAAGQLTHLAIDPAGQSTTTSLGDADQCWLGLDAAGTVHMLTRSGTDIVHATLE